MLADRQSGELPLGAQRQLPGMPHSGSFLVPEANRSPSEITCRSGGEFESMHLLDKLGRGSVYASSPQGWCLGAAFASQPWT
jgi:hypothetical protein